jgi:DNA repair exonuclease SbcCD ATPase subunit
MKILKAYFKNFQGIYTGMNRLELTLDFTANNISPFIVLFGKNASGKSTLLSCIQPFPGTNDFRTDPIIPELEGKKEIIFDNNGKIYKSLILYPKNKEGASRPTEKCFLYSLKSGCNFNDTEEDSWESLVPNGGKNAYIAAIEEHLMITKDFFSVGRIGGVSNFIDFNRSDRKKFIANFLPDVDPYLKINEDISKKYTAQKKVINTFGIELSKLIPLDECVIKLTNLTSKIEDNANKLALSNQEYGAAKSSVDKILNETANEIPELREFARTGKNPLDEKMEELQEKIKKLESNIGEDRTRESVIRELEELNEAILELSSEKSTAENNLSNVNRDKEVAELELNKLNSKLSAMSAKTGVITRLRESLASYEDTEKILMKENERFKTPFYKKFSTYSPDLMNKTNMLVMELKIALKSIREGYKSAGLAGLNLEDEKNVNNEIFRLKGIAKKFKSKKERIDELNEAIPLFVQKSKSEELLLKRPKECSINTCPFISDALEYSGSSIQLKKMCKELENLKDGFADEMKEWEEASERLSFLETYIARHENIKEKFVDQILLKNFVRIYSVVVNIEDYLKIIQSSESEFEEITNISNVEEYVNWYSNSAKVREEIMKTKERIEEINESVSLVESLKKDLVEKEAVLEKSKAAIIPLEKSFSELKEKLNNMKQKIAELKILVQSFQLLEEKKGELELIAAKSDLMKKYLDDVEKNRSIIIKTGKEINDLKEVDKELALEKDQIVHQIETRKDIEEKLAKLQEQFKIIEIIRGATDTVKGIPLYLIEAYLEDIRIMTNELLKIAYQGDFMLEKFVINEKEFSIPVIRGDGSRLEDITLGSGAEVALVKSSLSFAIVQKAIAGYNILYADELDSMLDESKRREFIGMLKKQIQDLGIEQVFIISHQREFLEEPLNLILLKDHGIETDNEEIMNNKNVVFNYYS